MKDKLKQFIEDNRHSFDIERPGHSLFGRIRGSGNPRYRRGRQAALLSRKWAAVAAAVLLVTGSIYLLMETTGSKKSAGAEMVNASNEDMIAASDPVYARQINSYREIIGLQQEELKKLKPEYPGLYKQFSGDINSLDSSYRILKDQLANHPNYEILLEAMLQNLQLQSELLTRQLFITREIKQKNSSHEKTRI